MICSQKCSEVVEVEVDFNEAIIEARMVREDRSGEELVVFRKVLDLDDYLESQVSNQ